MVKPGIKSGSAGIMLALSLCLALLPACARKSPQSQIDAGAYAEEIHRWQQNRWTDLKAESGWLTLVGLFWLKEGENNFGSDTGNQLLLVNQNVKPQAAVFTLKNAAVHFTAKQSGFSLDGKEVKTVDMKSDDDNQPTILHLGSLSLQIIKRGEKFGLRVKDSQNPDRLNFQNTEFYPADVKWRIDAQFEAYNPPKQMPIMNVLNMESAESSPGAVKFTIDGKEYRLDAITEKDEPRLFMIIADKTTGKETYPAGRYLYVDPPAAGGHVVIDFNKA